MNSESISTKAVKSTIWSALNKFSVTALKFFVNLLLARLLSPNDFGIIGMITIFIAISYTFVDGGFGSALIQKKNPTEIDYSTIFIWNVTIGSLFYIIIYFSSNYIAQFYRMPILSTILKVLGITVILGGIANILSNRLQKKLRFKGLAITDIASYIISAVIAVIMAFKNFGVWSLVFMSIIQPFIRIILMTIITKWIPTIQFSYSAFKELFSFSGYLFISNLLENTFKNSQGLVIGKMFSATQMGYYSQAEKLNNITSYILPQVITSVMYPIFSKYQDDREKLTSIILTNLKIISFIIFPLLTILILIAPDVIVYLYGTKWINSIPYFRILCVGGYFLCLSDILYYAIAACGKSKLLLMSSFYKWGMLALLMALGLKFGMDGLVWSISISFLNIFFTNCVLLYRTLDLSISSILKSVYITAFLNISIFSILIIVISYLNIHWTLIISIYIITYIISSYWLNTETVIKSLELIKKIRQK
ncbi:MAG: lipopolysaccharide biosynthesis protein [Muribaculaceae bacterium]|nr:lipopolysaccharide biosynthesis protein [Muribaculaceae bacterium]